MTRPVVIVVLAKYWEVFKGFLESAEKYAADIPKVLVKDGTEEWPQIGGHWRILAGPEKFSMAGNGNLGLKAADPSSDVLYCGDDVRFMEKDTVERLQQIAYSDSKIGLLSPRIVGRGSPAQVNPKDAITFPRALEFWFPCVYIKREVLERIGYLDEQFSDFGCDDLDFVIRAQMAGYKCAIAKDVAVEHEASPEGGPTTFVKNIGAEAWQAQQAAAQEKLRAKYGASKPMFNLFLQTGDVDLLKPKRKEWPDNLQPVAPTSNFEYPLGAGIKQAPKRTPQQGVRGKSLCVLTPMYGGMCNRNFVVSFVGLVSLCNQYQIPIEYVFLHNESLIPRGRNRLADHYLKQSSCTHSVYIDADIGFEPADVLGLMEMDLDIVGAGCTKKNIRWDRVQRVIKKNGRDYTDEELTRVGGDFVINFERFEGKRTFDMAQMQKVRQLGTGLLVVKREVYQDYMEAYPDRWYLSPEDKAALPGKIWDFFRIGINPEDKHYESEDYWFCNDCRALGMEIWLCPWMKTDHMGSYTYKADIPAVAMLAGEL